jgi:sarcosine oxidase subunit beta
LKTSVAIVGGGVVGASIGWHLSKLGVRDVVIFERGAMQGEGSTGRATGGFRAQYGTEINVRLSLLARSSLLRFREETGVDPGFEQRGYLWLAQDSSEMAVLREALRVQRAAGLHEARLVDTAGIARLNPYITNGAQRGDFAGGAFCPTDGFIKPMEILRGYSRGLDVRYGEEVVAVDREAGRVRALRLASGETVTAAHFVDAAGAWAGAVGRLAGVEVPVAPLRRQVAATALTKALPAELPMTIWMGDGFHFRGRDGRVLLLKPNPGAPDDAFSTALEADWIDEVVSLARERVPALAEVKIEPRRSWAGLYEMSPDKHALLGRAPGCENLWLANGSSGHGVMHAPALGLLLAEMIAGRRTSLDVRALRPERFAEGQPNLAPELL